MDLKNKKYFDPKNKVHNANKEKQTKKQLFFCKALLLVITTSP